MGVYTKPRGLWLSAQGDDDWPSWCVSEKFRLQDLAHAWRVELAPEAAVLCVSTVEELDAFTDAFGYDDALFSSAHWRARGIDWPRVAESYRGIVIAPYRWERRLTQESLWYYGWDCASGCVWDPVAISSLTYLGATGFLT